jgi:hypothetical protein
VEKEFLMKKFLLLAAAFVTLASYSAFADDLSMDTTALDQVGVAYSTEGTVALLGMVDNDGVSLTLNAGTYGASEPGAHAVLGGGVESVEKVGGRLHFTAYGIAGQKITVQQDSGSPAGYVDSSLGVRISDVHAGGSSMETLGLSRGWILPITGTPQTLIEGIFGSNTWTGTLKTDGAQVSYELKANPGVSRVDVLYTLIAN